MIDLVSSEFLGKRARALWLGLSRSGKQAWADQDEYSVRQRTAEAQCVDKRVEKYAD
jgi:hypothetical protein